MLKLCGDMCKRVLVDTNTFISSHSPNLCGRNRDSPDAIRMDVYSPALVLRSASVSSGAPWRVVVGERDIKAFATLIPAPLASPAAGTPRTPKEANPPGSGDAGFFVASASARSSKPGAMLDPPLASLLSLLPPLFRFDASFEGIRLEVLEGEGAEAVDAEGSVASCLECREGDPGVARPAAGENTRGRGGGGAEGIFATSGCWEESGRSGCSKVSRHEAGLSAVTEIKGVQLSLALGSVVAGEDVAGKERKVTINLGQTRGYNLLFAIQFTRNSTLSNAIRRVYWLFLL